VDAREAGRDAWELFEDPAGIQAWMTDKICAAVERNHGVTIIRS
jgi:hypothetical protein